MNPNDTAPKAIMKIFIQNAEGRFYDGGGWCAGREHAWQYPSTVSAMSDAREHKWVGAFLILDMGDPRFEIRIPLGEPPHGTR